MKNGVVQKGKIILGVMIFLIFNIFTYANEKIFEIGISQFAEHPALDAVRKGFEDELKEEGVNVNIDYKNSQGDTGTAGMIAQKFVADKKDLIFAIATVSAQAAKQATNEIPILFSAVTDPVHSQLVDSLENVGGNITGTSDATPIDKQLALFKKLDNDIKKVAIIYNTSESNSEIQIKKAKEIGKNIGIEIVPVGVNNINDIPQAVNSVVRKVDGFYTITDNIVASAINLISKTAIKNKKITIGAEEAHVQGGILMTDGLSYYELGRQTGRMAKEILIDGKKTQDMPVETLEKTTKIINNNTLEKLNLSKENEVFSGATFID
ncbi:ABC transporter substrate-binding protein [uncultured Fusobacterium sp.]|uniref:ABC transporter substrate-binding protein n=1 Tax=uncultured Fusobacterium sp. TaxID=159267 RepID=UPI0025D7EA75|nr:ABC transporter substrate-binding protein [uncultured Fusobacterium sp.]